MTEAVLTIYRDGLDFFGSIVQAVPDGAWQRLSPCAGWTASDVLGHVGETTKLGAKILGGLQAAPTAAEPPSTAIDGDPVLWWLQQAGQVRAALDAGVDLDREVVSPMGRRPIREGMSFPAADLYLHGWDLGAATGNPVTIPGDAIAFISGMFEFVPVEITRSPGVFGPAVQVGADATATQQLIAFTGRDPAWSQ